MSWEREDVEGMLHEFFAQRRNFDWLRVLLVGVSDKQAEVVVLDLLEKDWVDLLHLLKDLLH